MKVTALVPVYNEENTVESVLNTLDGSELISEIIVIDDASLDKSLEIICRVKEKSKKIK